MQQGLSAGTTYGFMARARGFSNVERVGPRVLGQQLRRSSDLCGAYVLVEAKQRGYRTVVVLLQDSRLAQTCYLCNARCSNTARGPAHTFS